MKIAEEYIKMLGMDDDKLIEYINKMSEKEAKGLLFQMISFSNNKRRKEIEKMNEQKKNIAVPRSFYPLYGGA